MEGKLLSVREAAEAAGVSEGLVYGWVSGGSLAHLRLGAKGRRGSIRIRGADLEAFLDSCRRGERRAAEPAKKAAPPRLKHLPT